jgi:hypothetical protein
LNLNYKIFKTNIKISIYLLILEYSNNLKFFNGKTNF